MGSAFGGGGDTKTSTSSTTPWGAQSGPLVDLFGRTTGLANAQGSQSYPFQGSNLYANINGLQENGANQLYNAGDAARNTGQGLTSAGVGALSNLNPASSTAAGFSDGNFNHGTTSAGTAAVGNVPNSIYQANQGIQGAMTGAANMTFAG